MATTSVTISTSSGHSAASPRVALVHDYLEHMRGGERVFELLAKMYPQADIFSLFFDRRETATSGDDLGGRALRTSFLRYLPRAGDWFRIYMPLYPLAASSINLLNYDLVISSSSAWAHGVRVRPDATHVCYCHSLFRYAWGHHDELVRSDAFRALVFGPLMHMIREWDVRASQKVDEYCANSEITRRRIKKYYGRNSIVVPPPVDMNHFSISPETGNYYLLVSALMPYKGVDIAIRAFNKLRLPLVIVGEGPEREKLESMAGPTVQLLGTKSDIQVADLYSRSRALVLPSSEDFGIAPLESMASGRPVIALAAGSALETVIDGVTGRFFQEQTAESLAEVLASFNSNRFDPKEIRQHAEQFDFSNFKHNFSEFVRQSMEEKWERLTASTAMEAITA